MSGPLLPLAGKEVLVTGGGGFIGSHLCDALLSLGATVDVLDNFSTGFARNVPPGIRTLWKAGVVDPPPLPGYDLIYHLACPASPPRYQEDPLETFRTAVLGTMTMLEESRRHGSRLLIASTSEVYGDPLEHPQKESYWGNVNPVGIRSCYDEGKRAAETVASDYRRSHGIDLRIIRIFNTYGPRMDPFDGRVVSNFIRQALSGEPMTIYGDGLQSRSFCYVSDLVAGILAASRVSSLPGPVNLGNPAEFTILELADLIGEILGTPVPREFRPLPEDDPKRRKPDIEQARKCLGWAPEVALREGVSRTIEDFRLRKTAGKLPVMGFSI